MILAEIILLLALMYVVCGLAVGVPFTMRGVDRLDEGAQGAPLGFRLIILPGAVALWPLLAARWIKAGKAEASHDA